MRIFGEDRPGVAAELTQRLADAGINLRGFSASVLSQRFVAYVGLDSVEDTTKALEVLQAVETAA
ncbi:MAG TPA: ACT domain-containing protein [Burkholderiales bacterium]|nr:ACT domain-containing protein [Burkholderiales bacterium]